MGYKPDFSDTPIEGLAAFLDVSYGDDMAVAAAIVARPFYNEILATYWSLVHEVAPYKPGLFYQRELPGLIKVLTLVKESLTLIFIDGYCRLPTGEPGLGVHLSFRLNQTIPIIGMAKNPYKIRSATNTQALVLRGSSSRPLYVSSVGINLEKAKDIVSKLVGDNRIPWHMTKAHQTCKQILKQMIKRQEDGQ